MDYTMDQNERMEWFRDAKFGIFMHWGIYAVKGVTESWSFFQGDISHEDYMAQCDGFTAENYDPKKWAELFKKIGARYTVLTTKHHDGVALWDTKTDGLSVVKDTPAGRDLIGPYCDAMREAGMKVGLYFSHLDWNYPDYPCIHPKCKEWWAFSPYTAPKEGEPDDLVRWEKFMKFYRTQLEELMTSYGTIDLLWFDGGWERTQEQWRFEETRDILRGYNPAVVMNDRIGSFGDYYTPEQAMPISRPRGDFEYCVTLNSSWGYQEHDTQYKSTRSLVRMLTEIVGWGGNFLLDIGPKPDGTIDERDEKALLALGDWVNQYQEAIFNTRAGASKDVFLGSSTVSKDGKNLYLFYYDVPAGPLELKGINTRIKKISVLGKHERELRTSTQPGFLSMPGLTWIELPAECCDPYCTVIKLEFDEPVSIHGGCGARIE